ncbi:uncharacterized protein LOC120329411 [Styela clava]
MSFQCNCDKAVALSTLRSEILDLRKENAILKQKLSLFECNMPETIYHPEFVDASCQTECDYEELKNHLYENTSNVAETLTAESIAQTARSYMNTAGWVYDEQRGIYFDYNTSLYYYPNTKLYYNYKNGCYYKYNQDSQEYEFQHQLMSFNDTSNTNIDRDDIIGKQIGDKIFFSSLKKAVFKYGKSQKSHLKAIQVNELCSHFTNSQSEVEGMAENNKNCISICKTEIGRSPYHDYSLSDSEIECIKSTRKNYLVCRKCSNITETCCCQNEKCLNMNINGKSVCNRMTRKDEKISELDSCSDTELETLSTHPFKFLKCPKCLSFVNSVCCEGITESRKRRKASDLAEDSNKRHCLENFKLVCDDSSKFSKEKVIYSMDCLDENDTDLDLETNVIPCIRAMVTSSKSLTSGTLFLITRYGAIFGSSENCEIQIQEADVSPKHAAVFYNQQQRNYFVTDYGSENGTTLNSITEHNPGITTVLASPITHKSVLIIGNTVFVLHLHIGYDTCDDCEPGQIQAMIDTNKTNNSVEILTKNEKEKQRRSELKNIRRKYNLHNDKYKQSEFGIEPQYVDRASERRRLLGSDNPYEKDEMPTSMQTELADHNKGHQMLKKMGWNKGQSLGKYQTGITEPIAPEGSGKGKFGLGYGKNR